MEKTYTTEYGEIQYLIEQANVNAPWLIFLPGLTVDHHLFDKQVEYFCGKYNCLTWDAPAHGSSRPFELKFSMDDIARYLHGILEQEEIRMPFLIGQSMGGYISQAYMELYPATVSGFISIDSCSLKKEYFSTWEITLLKHTEWIYYPIPWKLLIHWGSHGTATSNYGQALMKETMTTYDGKEYCKLTTYGYRIVAEAIESEHQYDLHCPTLLLCGDKDAAGSAKRYNRIWAEREGHPIIWLKGAGHNSNTDVPDQVNHIIEEFVNSHMTS